MHGNQFNWSQVTHYTISQARVLGIQGVCVCVCVSIYGMVVQ